MRRDANSDSFWARVGYPWHGTENTASSTIVQSRERVSMLQFLYGINTPQYCEGL
jgi:hypothetical protein